MSSSIAIISSNLFEKLIYPLNLVFNDTNQIANFYETVYSLPLLTKFREHLALISITLYLMWYIKVYLSVSFIFSQILYLNLIIKFKINFNFVEN